MSAGDLNINFSSDEKDLVKGQAKVLKQQDQMIQAYKKMLREAKTAAKQGGTELEKFAAKTNKINKRPAQRYREEIDKLSRALKAGLIDQTTYNAAVNKLKASHRGAFDTSGIKAFAGQFVGLTAAVGLFNSAMDDAKAKTDGAIQAVDGLVAARRRLLQVSEGTGGKNNQEMNDFADKLSLLGITREEGRLIGFSAKSEGYQGSESLVARLGAANVITPEAANRAAGQVRGIFKTISPIQAIAGVVNAAQASRLDVESFMTKMPKLAGGAKVAGSSAAEANAILSAVATEDDRAGEYVATLANSLAVRPEFADKPGIMGMVKRLQGMPEERRREFLGTGKEANLSYMWLTDYQDLIRQRTKTNQSAMNDAGGFVRKMEGRAFDPSTNEGRLNLARRDNIIANNQQEISRERRLAEGGLTRNAFATRQLTALEEEGLNPLGLFVSRKGMEYARDTRMPEWAIAAAGGVGRHFSAKSAVEALPGAAGDFARTTKMVESLARLVTGAGEKIDRAAGNLEGATEIGAQTNAARANQAAAGGATEAR